MGWIISESVRVVSPGFADLLVESEAAEGLEPLGKVVGVQEGGEVISELPMCSSDIASWWHPEGAVHAFDLAVRSLRF